MKKSKQSIYNILVYLGGLALLINNRTIWINEEGISFKVNIISYGILCVSLIILILFAVVQKKKITSNVLNDMLLLIGLTLVYFVFSSEISKSVVIRLGLLVILLFLYIYFENSFIPKILIAYKNILLLVGSISLFFWLFGSILGMLHSNIYINSNWGAVNGVTRLVPSYNNIYFETQRISAPLLGDIYRNSSIFSEGPMASLNFTLGLLIELIERKNKLSITVFILCVISTFSTTGYIVLLILLFMKFINTSKITTYTKLMLIVPTTILVAFLILFFINQKFINNSESASVRLNDFYLGFTTWLQHPIFGNGINNIGALTENMESWRLSNSGFSNSIMEVLAEGGIYVFSIYIYSFINAIKYAKAKRSVDLFCFIVGVIFLFVSTSFPFQYILITILIWFSMLDSKRGV